MKRSSGKRTTKEERWYMGQVSQLPCCITGLSPVEVHHAYSGRMGRPKWNGFSCMPLIMAMHSRYIEGGLHYNISAWEAEHGHDSFYIIETLQAIYGDRWSVDH